MDSHQLKAKLRIATFDACILGFICFWVTFLAHPGNLKQDAINQLLQSKQPALFVAVLEAVVLLQTHFYSMALIAPF